MKMSWIRTAALCAAAGICSAAWAEEPAKLHGGLRSSNGLIQDMEYLTVKLAKQKAVYDKDILPNIEIFLEGVNPELPVGMSLLFSSDSETGRRRMLQVPVDVLKVGFIDGNLVPIGIDAERDRKDKTIYELTGDAYEGWMRVKGNKSYASISEIKEDVPAEVVTPDVTLNGLFTKGYDFAVYSLNTEAEAKVRVAAARKAKDAKLADLKKKTDETQEAFELRKLILSQQADKLGQLFAESLLLEAGWTTDEAKHLALGQSHWTALPNTNFAKWITQLESTKSHFSSLSGSDKSVLTARVLIPTYGEDSTRMKEVYKQTPIVLKQQIEANKDLNAEEKAARIGATEVGIDALSKGLEVGVLDLFVDIAPSEGKYHSFVLGARSTDVRASIETLVGHLGKVRTGWSSQVNIETVGETKFHSFTVTKTPPAMLDFYGGDGTVYVAAGPDFVGFATGVGSLDVLKNLAVQATSVEKKTLESFVDVRFHALESLDLAHAFLQEKDFDLLNLMQNNGIQRGTPEPKSKDAPKGKKPVGKAGKNDAMSTLKNFEWQKTAIEAMRGTDELVTIQFKLTQGAIDGETKVSEGVLTGLGAVIAKFAKENFGGGK